MNTRHGLIWLLVLGCGCMVLAQAVEPSARSEALNCGTVALYHLFRLEGRRTSLEVLGSALPAPGREGYSLLDLRRAAHLGGLPLDAVVLPKRRSAIVGPTVFYLKESGAGHFIVVRPVGHTGKLIQVLDGEREPLVADADWLFASPAWTGIALVPHRTNYLVLNAGSLSGTCLLALSVLWWRRWRARFHGVPRIARDPVFAAAD